MIELELTNEKGERLMAMITPAAAMMDYITDAECVHLTHFARNPAHMVDTACFLAWRHVFNAMGAGPETPRP